MSSDCNQYEPVAENMNLMIGHHTTPTSQLSGTELVLRPVRPFGKRPGSATVGVTIDRTGSGLQFQDGIRQITTAALRSLAGTIATLNIHLWTHGDEDHGEAPVQLVQSGSVDTVIEAIHVIKYGGGFDAAETHAEQLQRILDVTPWGLRALYCRNVALGLLTDETKPLRSGKSMISLGSEFKAKGVKLVLVCQPTPNLQELVGAAGGYLIPISNTPDKAELQKVVESLCATLTIAVTAAGKTIPMSVVEV